VRWCCTLSGAGVPVAGAGPGVALETDGGPTVWADREQLRGSLKM
jgi:hypothetical protein